jgi:hypothetical protein
MSEIENALDRLASVLTDWAPPVWVSLHFSTPIYKDNCGGMSLEASKEGGDVAQLPFDWDGIDVLTQSALQIRDHLFLSTGKRIWGLTLTLYRNGTYDIAYDYNKPEDYQDSDEVASTSSSSPVADLLGGLLDPSSAVADSTFQQQALQSLQTQTAHNSKAWGLGTETQWNLEMDTGTLRFTFSDGRVLTAPVQVVGTYNTSGGTFLWGWDHPSVPEPLRRAAQRVHDYGQAHGIEAFTTRSTTCSESDAWGYAAVAAQLDEAAGAYRGDAGGTWVYMVFAPPAPIGKGPANAL